VEKRRILVVGYPKSGSTWLTRLTAELLGAPVKGFWKASPGHDEIAIEGEARVADMAVYKGHQPCAAVAAEVDLTDVIYMVRDVRDVAVSGANYFSFGPRSFMKRVTARLRRVYESRCELRRVPDMLRVLAEGDAHVSEWCSRPWDECVNEYLDAGALVVRYEDLLAAPERQCRRLLAHLGVERSPASIRTAIAAQSFAAVKRKFLERADLARATFLREGRAGAWHTVLTARERVYCLERFGGTLARLGYDLEAQRAAPRGYSS
jgi:Sulfotransferase domain